MPAFAYQRILDGTSVAGKFGESLEITERWQIRVDTPLVNKADLLEHVSLTSGVTWGASHFEFPALKALEFNLSPEGKDGLRWILTVNYYMPKPPRVPKANGIPEDVWERSGGTTTVPAFTDKEGVTICNSAGDPLEGMEKEREESSWTLTKFYTSSATLEADISAYAGKVNSELWAGRGPRSWKCYFKGAKRETVSKLDGVDDAGKLEFIESKWEFRYQPDTWNLKPWDVGFMELASGERKTILGNDQKPVKQPVALNSDGSKKAAGQRPGVIRSGAGAEVYNTANWTDAFGLPTII
jgi:hypothetical protein